MDEFQMKIGKLWAEMGIFVGSQPERLGTSQECGKTPHPSARSLWQRNEGETGNAVSGDGCKYRPRIKRMLCHFLTAQ